MHPEQPAATELTARCDAARRVVMNQTGLLHRAFGRVDSSWKEDGSRITPTDLAISEAIGRELAAEFPDDQFFSEELAATTAPLPLQARYCWILDPIDGTNNFALGLAHCAISLALCEHGEPVYGVIYDLSRRILLHGGPGGGAFDGERLMHVRTGEFTRETLVGIHSPSDRSLLPMAAEVMSQFKIRGLGSATLHLAYVAAGMLDGCVDFNVKLWDLAAAIPLVRAAGGEVRFLNGAHLPLREFDVRMPRIVYVAGSPAMCARLQALMAG